MYAKRIIPCLDVNNGRVVKGTNFVNLRDAGDPVEAAKAYDAQGADELVFLDITASAQAVSYTHLDVYKRQIRWSVKPKWSQRVIPFPLNLLPAILRQMPALLPACLFR